jgi:hypothetical protein
VTKWVAPYDGTDWYFNDDRHLTSYEGILVLDISGGLYGDALTAALAAEHPKAWLAVLVVARKRAGLSSDRARKVDADLLVPRDCLVATVVEQERLKAEDPDAGQPAADSDKAPAVKPRRAARAKAELTEDAPAA